MCCTYLAIQFWTCSNYIVSQSGSSGLTGFGGLLFVCTAWKAALQSGQWRLAAVLCSMRDRDWRQWIVADSEQHRRSVTRLAFIVFIGEQSHFLQEGIPSSFSILRSDAGLYTNFTSSSPYSGRGRCASKHMVQYLLGSLNFHSLGTAVKWKTGFWPCSTWSTRVQGLYVHDA